MSTALVTKKNEDYDLIKSDEPRPGCKNCWIDLDWTSVKFWINKISLFMFQ